MSAQKTRVEGVRACRRFKSHGASYVDYRTFNEEQQVSLIILQTANPKDYRQRYSHYLPLYLGASQTTSRAASFSKDSTRSPRGSRSGRLSSSLQSAKRRSTMNSRDAAYDEEEQLRRAIEASKGEKSGESTDGGTRRGKRGRSDSEEYVAIILLGYDFLLTTYNVEDPRAPRGGEPCQLLHHHLETNRK